MFTEIIIFTRDPNEENLLFQMPEKAGFLTIRETTCGTLVVSEYVKRFVGTPTLKTQWYVSAAKWDEIVCNGPGDTDYGNPQEGGV